jgi:hypothetical protein
MMALTLWQPWAQAVAAGMKRVETRPTWATRFRSLRGERLAIHAASPRGKADPSDPIWQVAARDGRVIDELRPLDFGAILAVVTIGDVIPTQNVRLRGVDCSMGRDPGRTYREVPWGPLLLAVDRDEWRWGDYTLGRYAVVLEDVQRLSVPVAAKGAQQLWRVPDDVLEHVERGLAA